MAPSDARRTKASSARLGLGRLGERGPRGPLAWWAAASALRPRRQAPRGSSSSGPPKHRAAATALPSAPERRSPAPPTPSTARAPRPPAFGRAPAPDRAGTRRWRIPRGARSAARVARRRGPRGSCRPPRLLAPPEAPTPVARAAVLRVRGLPRAPDPEASFHLDWIFRDF